MESKKRLYIVSFGDSRKYRLPFEEKRYDDNTHHSDNSPLTEIEQELNAYLRKRFPDDTFAYYTSPKVSEVDYTHSDRYSDYPLLDASAIEEIKEELAREIEDMEANRRLNSDAPYSNIPCD